MKHDPTLIHQKTAATTAVFIDADNLSASHAPAILDHIGKNPRLIRAYGDIGRAKAWEGHPAVEMIHTGKGKNASDLALAVDAMDAAHRFDLSQVVICSCDRDFRHLAFALRKMGINVIGMGSEINRPESFAAACSSWISLQAPTPAPATPSKASAPSTQPTVDDKLKACLAVVGDQTLSVTTFAQTLNRDHQLKKKDFKAATWAKAFSAPNCQLEVFGQHPNLNIRRRRG